MSNRSLNACPFCGCDRVGMEVKAGGPAGRDASYNVRCHKCMASCAGYGTHELATHHWNKRAQLASSEISVVNEAEIDRLVQEDLDKSDEQIWAEAVQRHGSPAAALKEADRIRDIIKRATDSVCPRLPLRQANKPVPQQGVFRKFDVRRMDGQHKEGCKHYECEYFVLDVTHDQHAKAALAAYAQNCSVTHPVLSKDMIARYELRPYLRTVVSVASEESRIPTGDDARNVGGVQTTEPVLVAQMLKDAQEKVRPIIEKEREAENLQGLGGFRMGDTKIAEQPVEWSETMTDQEKIYYWSTECVKAKAELAKAQIEIEIERRSMKRESGVHFVTRGKALQWVEHQRIDFPKETEWRADIAVLRAVGKPAHYGLRHDSFDGLHYPYLWYGNIGECIAPQGGGYSNRGDAMQQCQNHYDSIIADNALSQIEGDKS